MRRLAWLLALILVCALMTWHAVLAVTMRLTVHEAGGAVLKAVNLVVPLQRERDWWMAKAIKAEVRIARMARCLNLKRESRPIIHSNERMAR